MASLSTTDAHVIGSKTLVPTDQTSLRFGKVHDGRTIDISTSKINTSEPATAPRKIEFHDAQAANNEVFTVWVCVGTAAALVFVVIFIILILWCLRSHKGTSNDSLLQVRTPKLKNLFAREMELANLSLHKRESSVD